MAGVKINIDEDMSDIMKNMGYASTAFEKCFETNDSLVYEIELLKREILRAQEAEKTQNNSLMMSRKIIGDQQAIITKLVSTKEEFKTRFEKLTTKTQQIEEMEEEKSLLLFTYQKEQEDMLHRQKEELILRSKEYEKEVTMLKKQYEFNLLESTKKIGELNAHIEEINTKRDTQVNSIVVECEEQLQRAHAHSLQMRKEFQIIHEKNRTNIAIYKRKIFDLERNSEEKKNVENKNFCVVNEGNNSKMMAIGKRVIESESKVDKKSISNTASIQHNIEYEPAVKTAKRKLFNKLKFSEFIED